MNVFAGLESLGLKNLGSVKLYEENEKTVTKDGVIVEKKEEVPVDHELESLFDKSRKCPCCNHDFTSRTIRTGKTKLISTDMGLRPKYEYFDPLKYDVIVCPRCGYAALTRFFDYLTSTQSKWIKESISTTFKLVEGKTEKYSYDEAIIRYKLALLNTVVKKSKNSEKAYTSMKLSWMYRGKIEQMLENDPDADVSELKEEERTYIQLAYEGFANALAKEFFPICGMDEITLTYLMADLARRLGNYAEARKCLIRVLSSRTSNKRIKDKAFEMKDLIKHEIEETEAKE